MGHIKKYEGTKNMCVCEWQMYRAKCARRVSTRQYTAGNLIWSWNFSNRPSLPFKGTEERKGNSSWRKFHVNCLKCATLASLKLCCSVVLSRQTQRSVSKAKVNLISVFVLLLSFWQSLPFCIKRPFLKLYLVMEHVSSTQWILSKKRYEV